MTDDTKEMVQSHVVQARRAWESFAANTPVDGPPTNPIDALQVELVRWQRNNFGDQSDERYALGVIEEFGETLAADELDGPKGKLDGLGDICVYTGQLLNNNRLAIRPVLELARLCVSSARDQDNRVAIYGGHAHISIVGQLSHCVLKHAQKIRNWADPDVYRLHLVDKVAWIIASAELNIRWSYATEVAFQPNMAAGAYVKTANTVVLKRDWVSNPETGGTV